LQITTSQTRTSHFTHTRWDCNRVIYGTTHGLQTCGLVISHNGELADAASTSGWLLLWVFWASM